MTIFISKKIFQGTRVISSEWALDEWTLEAQETVSTMQVGSNGVTILQCKLKDEIIFKVEGTKEADSYCEMYIV